MKTHDSIRTSHRNTWQCMHFLWKRMTMYELPVKTHEHVWSLYEVLIWISGGYIYLSMRAQDKNQALNEDMFVKLTSGTCAWSQSPQELAHGWKSLTGCPKILLKFSFFFQSIYYSRQCRNLIIEIYRLKLPWEVTMYIFIRHTRLITLFLCELARPWGDDPHTSMYSNWAVLFVIKYSLLLIAPISLPVLPCGELSSP